MSEHAVVRLEPLTGTRAAVVFGGDAPWALYGLDGWDDLSAGKSDDHVLALGHGSIQAMADPLRQATSGTLRVGFDGTAAEVAEANLALWALCAYPLRMTVTDHDGVPRSRRVVVEQGLAPDRHQIDERMTASLVWSAADPRRYGEPVVIPAGANCVNEGTAPVSPVILLSDVSSTVSVTEVETGRILRWQGTVAPGKVLRVDPALGVATVDGAPVMGLRRFEWPIIPPGGSRSYTVTGASLSVECRSAWW